MGFECAKCKKSFESEHDVELYFDQDTNLGHYVCHDCLIVAARPRRFMLKSHMKYKTQAIERKRRHDE